MTDIRLNITLDCDADPERTAPQQLSDVLGLIAMVLEDDRLHVRGGELVGRCGEATDVRKIGRLR